MHRSLRRTLDQLEWNAAGRTNYTNHHIKQWPFICHTFYPNMASNNTFYIILALLWIVYVTLHSVMASLWFKAKVKRWMGVHFNAYRLIYTVFAAATLILLLIYQYSNESAVLFYTPLALEIVAGLTALAGLTIMIASIWKYFFQLSGLQILIEKKQAQTPQTDGPNAYVRHPLYSGTLLFLWSLFVIFPLASNAIACIIITVYTVIGIGFEEQKLAIEYGDSYLEYKKKVPMLIPFTKANRS